MIDEIINITALTQSYGNKNVIDGITASASKGQVIGLLGRNGAGKTTLLETLLGFNPPASGEVQLFGIPAVDVCSSAERTKIGFVPQQDELLRAITGREYLSLIASFYSEWAHTLIDQLATDWQIDLDVNVDTLSLGQRQKLSIISVLGHQPQLLVLDEPVASLDPIARRLFLRELVTLATERAVTILFSTHILQDLERIAERVWFLRDGKLSIDATLDDLKEQTQENLEEMFLREYA